MEYINEGSTLPPPLNIVPTPKGIYVFIKKMLNFIEKRRNMFTLKDEYKPKVNGNLNGHTNGLTNRKPFKVFLIKVHFEK